MGLMGVLTLKQALQPNISKTCSFMHHFIPLINKPTREVKNSKTIIDNIFCNVPLPFNMCDFGIICPYISDHHAIFCILKHINLQKSLSLLLNVTYPRKILQDLTGVSNVKHGI